MAEGPHLGLGGHQLRHREVALAAELERREKNLPPPAEYPFYGAAELEPSMSLPQALDGDSAVVAEEFLIRLNARVGQTLRLGGRDFRIAAVLRQEPDLEVVGEAADARIGRCEARARQRFA